MATATKEPKRTSRGQTKTRPLGDRIVVRRLEAEEKTAGGIVLPDRAREKPLEGTVIAVGPGRLLDNGERATLQVEVGDRVLFGSYAGSEVKIGSEELVVLSEDDVLAIVEK